LITAFDVIILLALRDPLRSTPVKMFEILIAGLVSSSQQRRLTIIKLLEQVLAVLICMLIIISKMDVDWPKTFEGFLPSKYIFGHGGLYICNFSSFLCWFRSHSFSKAVGILGATVMPHSLFLGSALATQHRLTSAAVKLELLSVVDSPETTLKPLPELSKVNRFMEFLASLLRTPPPSQSSTRVKSHADRENNPLAFIQAHLNHGTVDIVGSLLGFAVPINSSCAPVFFDEFDYF
jgi:metal iron transporter